LLKLGLSLTEINNSPALLLDELLEIDAIYREVGDAGSGSVDS
jgi:hypothetical protein